MREPSSLGLSNYQILVPRFPKYKFIILQYTPAALVDLSRPYIRGVNISLMNLAAILVATAWSMCMPQFKSLTVCISACDGGVSKINPAAIKNPTPQTLNHVLNTILNT